MSSTIFNRSDILRRGLCLLLFAVIVISLGGCGTIWHAEYSNPKLGDGSVDVVIPEKSEGFSK